MDDHIKKLNIKIRNTETELNALFTKIRKLEDEIGKLNHKKISCEKTGSSRDDINRQLAS